MAANYEDIKWLYDKLKSQGYNIGNENEFTASLANESDRQWYYEKAKGMGLNFSNIDDFNSLYAPAAPQSNSAMGRVARKVTDIYEQARKDLPAAKGGSPTPTAAAPTPQVKETASAAPATAKPEVEETAPEAPKGWQPTMQQRLATAQTLNGGMTSFRASAAAGRERTRRAMERNTPQGRGHAQAAQMQARMAGLPTQVFGIGAAAPKGVTGSDAPSTQPQGVTGKAAEVSRRAMERATDRELRSMSDPVVVGMVQGPDGKPVTQWELPDGTLTTDFAEADRAAASSRRNRLAHEFTRRMEQNGLDPGKQEDVMQQAAVEAIKTGNGMDAGKRADIVAALRDNGLDPENEEHIMWAVTGDERKMLEYRLHKTESELKELNHKRAEMRQGGSQVGYGGFVSGAGQIPTPHPTVTGATQSAIDKEIENATAEVVMLRNAIRDFDNNKSASGKNWFGKIMQGLWDGVSDPNTWTSGILDLSVNSTARNANPLTGSGRSLLESWQMSQEMMAKSPNPGGFYNGGHFAGEMLADPVTYISAVAGMGATKMASGAMVKATGKRMSKEVAERFAANRLGNRLVSAGVGTGANLFTFEGLRDMRQQAIDGGWIDSNGQFHEGFSWSHALKEGGSGFLLGTTMGVFGAGIGNVGNWAVKNVSKSSLAGKAAIRGAQHGVSFVGEGTIFAIPEIINFHTMDDKTFDELYAEKFGYDSITDASERKQERDKARNSLSWDAWSESQAMIFGMKVAGKATHPKKMITDVSTRLTSLRRQGARDHVTFSEKVKRMLDQSPLDMSFTSDEREELREGGYGELAELFRKGNHTAENPAFDGYEAMELLMKDRRVSQAARAKAYFILTGRMLPPATVTGYTSFKEPEGRVTVKSITENGEVVTSRTFRNEKESRQEVENIRRQAELNSIEIGERRAEDVAADMILDAALKEVAPDANPIAIADICRAVKEGEKDVTESEIQLAEQIDEAIVRNKHVADKYLPEAIREALKEETGIDVDAALRKALGKRTEAERKVIEDYLAALYPDGIGEDTPHSNRGTMGNGEVPAVDSAENDVNLQGERNSEEEDYGNRPQQDNDGPGYSSGLDGGSMAGNTAGSVAADRDRGDIRMYEEGLGSSQNEYSEYSERDRREAESERLVGIARANDQYITRDELRSRGKLYPKGTGESEVVIDAEGGRVYKIKNPYAKSPMKGNVEPEDAIFEHLVHNRYFPETAYRFEGISDDAGDVRIVLSQDYIESVGQPTQKQIDAALAEKGLKPEGKYTYGNEEVSVTDVTGDNALVGADGKVYFIDPVINFKKPVREILGEVPYPQPTEGERAMQEAEQTGYNMTGLEERQQAMRNFRYWEGRMEELFGHHDFDEMLEAEFGISASAEMLDALEESRYNADERAVIAGYIKSRESSDAIFRRVRDDYGATMEQQNTLLDKECHEDGYIRPAMLKGESGDAYIYIVKGNVVPTEDGRMINTAASDDVIYIYDPTTDKVKQTSSSQLASLGTPTSAEEARSEMERINVANYNAAVDVIYGRTGTFSPGDTFVADVWGEGPQENKVVGTGENGMVIFETEGKKEQYGLMPDQILSMVERYEQEVFNAEMRRQEETMTSAEEIPSDRLGEATAEPAPSAPASIKYDQGDSFRVAVSDREETQQAAVVDREGETVTIWTPFPVSDKSEKGRTMSGYTTDISRADLDGIVVRDEQGKPVDYVAANPETEPEPAHAEAPAESEKTVEIPHSIRNAMEEEAPAIDERYTQPITDSETLTPDVEPMPMRTMKEKGEVWKEPDYLATTPQRAHSYIYNESGLSRQEANDHVAHMARSAKEAVDKHKKSAPKIGGSIARFQKEKAEWEKRGAELQRAVEFWDAIKVEQKKVADAERSALEAQQAQAHDKAVARFEEEQRIKAAKQAEQDVIGTNAVNPKLKAKWDAAPKVVGNANAHVLSDGSSITGHYVLTEAGAASASHDPNNAFAPTEGFPIDENGQNVNDRDYERDKDAQRMVENMGAAFDSRALQTPVIVSQDGIVLSGNNRTMSGDLAAAQGTDKAYVNHLTQYGSMYGFTPRQVTSMKHPRVVFVPDEALPYDSTTFSRFNSQEMKSQSKPEAAVKLGKIVPDAVFNSIVGDINRYERMSDFYANESAAASALGALHAAGVINDAQMPELRTGTALSAAGKELLENTLIGKVFQSDPDAVRKIMEIPSMRQTIVMALAEVANNRALAGKGFDIVDELSKAVDLCYRAKSAHPDVYVPGIPVSPFGRQQGLFDDEYGESRVTDATTLLLADLLNDTKPSRLRNVLTIYNKEAGNSAAGSMDLFTGEIPSKETILTEINNHFINATPKEQQAIVDAAIAERRAAAVTTTEESGEGSQRPEQAPAPVQRSERNEGNSLGETRDRSIDDFFGPVYTEFQGKGSEAEAYLREMCEGVAKGALTYPGITPIDLAWGDNKAGYMKIVIKHPEVVGRLQELLDQCKITNQSENRIILQSDTHKFIVSKMKGSTPTDNWLLTAYHKKEKSVSASSSDIETEPGGKRNGTATPQNGLSSDGKVNNSTLEKQEEGAKSSEAEAFGENNLPKKERMASMTYEEVEQIYADYDAAIEERYDAMIEPLETEKAILENKRRTPAEGKRLKAIDKEIADLERQQEEERLKVGKYFSEELRRRWKTGEHTLTPEEDAQNLFMDEADAPKAETATKIAAAEAEVNTEPTEAQKKAGNYKMGHVEIDGLEISIENPKGSKRSGKDPDGPPWETEMKNTYGYIKGTTGVDGDKIDVFLSDNPTDGDVYVVDQYNKDGSFDEHKVMYGFTSATEAEAAYLSNYSADWAKDRKVVVTGVTREEFKKWLDASDRKKKPFAEYKSVKVYRELNPRLAIEPDGFSDFGPVFTQFKGNAQGAIKVLSELQDGEAIGALHHKDIGDIDLVWGNAGTAKSDGFGLAKLVKYHPEVVEHLQEILDDMHIVKRSENRINLESDTHKAAVRLTWNKERKKWLLTAFEKKETPKSIDKTTDTGDNPMDLRGDTALSQNSGVSDGKVNTLSADKQDEGAANSEGGLGEMKEAGSGAPYTRPEERELLHAETPHSNRSAMEGKLSQRVYEAAKGMLEAVGIPVAEVNGQEAQEMLGNLGDDVRLMGSRTDRKMAKIAEHYAGKELDDNQQAVVDVFSGKRDNVAIEVERADGKKRVVMRQGREPKAGTKHSLYRHFEAQSDYFTANEIAMIPGVIAKGERHIDGKRVTYDFEIEDGSRLRVTTELQGDKELFTNYYSNKKPRQKDEVVTMTTQLSAPHSDVKAKPQNSDYRQAQNGNTQSSAQASDSEVSGAKVDNNSETGKRQLLKTAGGVVYGWTQYGKVYLNRDAMNPETPLHEYTHLWDEMVRRENPQLWARGKELLQKTPMWDEVMNDPNYQNIRDNEDAVASEVHSRLTGKDGARILADMIEGAKKKGVIETAQAVTLVERLKGWLADMFKSLKKTLGKWSKRDLDNLTVDDFNRMTLRDLAEGVNPDVELRDGETDRFHAAMSHRREDFAEVRERAVAERGIVMPGLKDKTVRVVEVPRHDFKGSGKEALKAAEKWAKENIVGVHQATDSRGDTFDYSISKDAVEKYVSRSATDKSENIGVHLAALKKLPEIIGNSIEAEVHADYHKDSRQVRTSEAGYNPDNLIHRFYGAANIDGAIYRVKTTIIESGIGQKNKPHSYEVTTMELTEEPAGQGWHERAGTASTLSRYSGSSSETGMAVHTFTLPVAKLLKGAEKSYDSGKKLLDESARDLKYRTPEEGIEYVNGRAIQPWSERLDYLRRKRDERGYSLSSSEREEVRDLGAQEKAWEEKWAAGHTDTDVPTGRRSRFEFYADQYGQGGMTAELIHGQHEAGPQRDSEGRLISANARDMARRAMPILMRRRADLLADRPSFSRAGQAAIDAELADLEYMALYYQRMEAGEDVERTMPGRLEHQRMLATAREVAESLGEKVVLYEAPGDIHDSDYNRQIRKQRSYGWYNPNDGTIHINVGRHKNAREIVKTVLHEIVGHKTIEQIMGPKRFARLIDEIWNHAGKKVRAKIAEKMRKNGWDYREATKEYLGEIAEEVHTKGYETLEAEKKTIWQRVKAKIQDFLNRILEGMKVPAHIRLSENDLSYMMWKLYKHKERKAAGKPAEGDIFDKAEEIVRREQWERDGNSLEIAARSEDSETANNGKEMAANKVVDLFNKAVSGDLTGKPVEVGELTKDGKEYLEKISGIKMKENISFVLNPSDLAHIHKDHFGRNEKDLGNNIPLTIEDIRNIAGIISKPEKIIFAMEPNGLHRKMFYFLAPAPEGAYNLLEIYSDKKGNLTAKTFYKTRKAVSQRVLSLLESEHLTSATDGASLSDNAKLPIFFDIPNNSNENSLHFRDGDDMQNMTIEEQTLKLSVMLADRHSGDVAVRDAAVEALGKTLGNIRKAMAVQHTYDFNTVRSLGAVADILISSGTFLPEGPGEVKRLYGIMKRGIGHAYTDDAGVEHVTQSEKDYNNAVESLMDLFVSNQLKLSGKFLDEVMKIRGSKVNARGVEVMGDLDVEGQIMVRGMKDYMNMDVQAIHDRIDTLDDIIANGNDAASMNAAAEKMGLELAEQYVAEVSDRVAQEKIMRDQLRDMTSQWDASMSGDARKAYTEQKRALRESIRKIRIERADAMRQLASQVGNELRNSIERVQAFREREKQRIEEIWHNANSDMQGRPHYEHGMEKKGMGVKLSNNMVSRLLLAPAATFEQVMRVFGSKSVDGEGYLFDRYVRGWQECRDKEWTSTQEVEGILDKKAAEILGKRKARWSDLYALTRKAAGSCDWWDGGQIREHKVTQGNLMYMYMVNKMTDGQVKLRRMCITDDKMLEIEQALDPKLKAVADWLQEELLPSLRNKYNEVHMRMFGAPMAEIENYFPLKILANARLEEVEMAGKIDGKDLPKTMTGAIIKRRFNNYALDVLNSDAVSVALDHIREMETWAAFAEYRRDLCTLLSYKHFRNQVKNMSTIYGSGEKFWDKFYDLALLVGGAYQPKTSEFDKAAVNITKLATGACIAIRLNTALKQLLSYPAFAPDANKFRLMYNVTPWRARACWKWAMKNMPSFQRRWKSRQAGNDLLRAWKFDWDWTRTDFVQKVQRAGITPNAFIDALTVAMGSEAVYHNKLKSYMKDGFSKEEAHRRAIQDAEIIFNLSQQSSELPYLSLLQNDRSYLTTCITNFRNSPMSYLRQSIQSKRELANMVKGKEVQIEFETKKGVREGLTPEQAKARAERKYKRNWVRNLFKSTTFDYILPALWAFGLTGMWYCIFGDDEKKKKELAEDAMKRGFLGGLEGFTFGGTMPDFMYGLATGDKPQLDEETSPAMGLITDMANLYSNGKTERAANEMINTMIALGVGFNPQVLEDGVVAGMDFFGHDEKNARDWALLFMRVLSCPQSQMDQVYFDELGMDAREAQRMSPAELADRYATYKARRANFATMWAYDDNRWETEIKGTWRKRFEKEAKERLKGQSEDHVNASLERYESEFSQTKKRLETLADSSDIIGNAAKAQAIFDSPEGRRYDLQQGEHMKSTLDKMIKSWLNAPTPEEAATEASAIIEYKAGVVEMLDAWEDPLKSRAAKERVRKIVDDWHERHAPKM